MLGAGGSFWIGANCLRFFLGFGAVLVTETTIDTSDAGSSSSTISSSSRSGVTAATLLGVHGIAALSLLHLLGTAFFVLPGAGRIGVAPTCLCCTPFGSGHRVTSGGGGVVRGLTDRAISEHSKLHAFLNGGPNDHDEDDSCLGNPPMSPVHRMGGDGASFLDGESRFFETDTEMSIDGLLDGRDSRA